MHMFGGQRFYSEGIASNTFVARTQNAILCSQNFQSSHFWTRKPHINTRFDYITFKLILKRRELNYHCIAQKKKKKMACVEMILKWARNRLEAFGNKNRTKIIYLHICAISMCISYGFCSSLFICVFIFILWLLTCFHFARQTLRTAFEYIYRIKLFEKK